MKNIDVCTICGDMYYNYDSDHMDSKRLTVNYKDKSLPSAAIKYINVNGEKQWVCHRCANLLAVSYQISSTNVPAVESLTRDEDRE